MSGAAYSRAAFLGLLIVATARIVATYNVFNDTVDETAHIGCGMEWLANRTYRLEPQHPPLARALTALGPYLSGARFHQQPDPWREGRAILTVGNRYDRMLALARLGILPFFWLASLVVYVWTRRSFGEPAAFFATLTFTVLPPVLAHAGLATTDMALTATLGAAFLALLLWIEEASPLRTALLDAALAATVLSKFSSLAFLPAATLAALICYFAVERPRLRRLIEWVRPRALPFAAAAAIASLLIWAAYRFSFDRFPAPELWQGIRDVQTHNEQGHAGYLLGQYGEKGWWYYYAAALAVKTPLAMLALLGVGAVLCWKRRMRLSGAYCTPLPFALGILLFASLYSHINLGIRHILPVYIGFSVVAGIGAQWLWSRGAAARAIVTSLLAWMVISSAASHPDYLAYFNAIAGSRPENILVDSDLDWGQDMKRLAHRLKEAGATEVAFDPFNKSYVEQLESTGEFPRVKPLDPHGPARGWNAASLTMLKVFRLGLYKTNPGAVLWTDRIPPTERVGKSVVLWYVP